MKTLILIPILNEELNIPVVIQDLLNLRMDLDILFVDDGSVDDSIKVINEFKGNINLIQRCASPGIGASMLDGFRWAYKNNYDLLIQLDCDGTHPVPFIPYLIGKATDSKILICSRWVKGGGMANWPLWRTFLSKGSNRLAALLLNLAVKDLTTAFRLYPKKAIELIALRNSMNKDYFYIVEILYLLDKYNFQIEEIPTWCQDRALGVSKMNLRKILRSVYGLYNLWRNGIKGLFNGE